MNAVTTTPSKPALNWRGIRTLIRKDLMAVTRSKAVLIPLIVVPLIMQVLIPAGFGITANFIPAGEVEGELGDLQTMFERMPPALVREFAGLTPQQTFLVLMLVYFFAPMYLIVPMMVSSVFAADSFAGEKERKTLEALLHTPLSDTELIVGKLLAAWLPAVAVAVVGFLLYAVIANATGYPIMGRIFFPNVMWLVLVFWVSPAASALGLAATVLISSKVKTFQEAYQMGGMVVIPVVALMLGQASGLLFLSPLVAVLLGVLLWFAAGVLLALAIGTFQRTELIARL
jgi:ABC-type Na+ efflux pump permease subunit